MGYCERPRGRSGSPVKAVCAAHNISQRGHLSCVEEEIRRNGSQRSQKANRGFACAVKRARHSSGRRISHPATVAPAGSNRSVRSGQLLRTKPSVEKVAEKATSERAGHNMSERRASLEKGNVNAELVRNKRRPPSLREASEKSTAEGHRGIGDGMCAKEGCVNTGSPMRRGGRLNRRPVRERPGRIGWRRGP